MNKTLTGIILSALGLVIIGLIAITALNRFQEQERKRQFLATRAKTLLKSNSLQAGDSAEKVKTLFPNLASEVVAGKADLTYYIPSKEEASPDYPHRLGDIISISIREEKITFIKREKSRSLVYIFRESYWPPW